MKIKEMLKEIEGSYNNYFPKSICQARFSRNLYSSISITCYLAGDKTEFINGISQNDMFSINFSIDTETGEFNKDITEESEVPENLKLKTNNKSYTIKPEDQYMAYGRRKLNFRKTKGDSKKIIKTLDKFFSKLKEQLIKDIEENVIHDNHIELLTSKIKDHEVIEKEELQNILKETDKLIAKDYSLEQVEGFLQENYKMTVQQVDDLSIEHGLINK